MSNTTNNAFLSIRATTKQIRDSFSSKASDTISEPGSDKSFDKSTSLHDAKLECKRTQLKRNRQLQAMSMFRV